MKIAMLSFYSGLVNRGIESWTDGLAGKLAERGHEVAVLQSGPPKKNTPYKTVQIPVEIDWGRKGYNGKVDIIRRFFVDYWSRKVAFFTFKCLGHLFKERYDVIIPTNGGWQVALIRILTWVRGGKMVVVGHSGKGWDERNNLWNFPDAFVALSSTAFSWSKRVNPFVKVEYIPNGVDIRRFTPEGEKFKTSLEKPVVLAVGALTKTKRLDLTIKAVAKLKNMSLLLVGEGKEKRNLENLGKKLLKGKFEMARVPHTEMPKVYRAADLFSAPSAPFYPFEIVLLEAMATNLPVVATDDPIRREIIGDAGILVDPEDTKEYAKAIKEALKRDWGDKPRKQAEKFSWDKIAKEYENLFTTLLE